MKIEDILKRCDHTLLDRCATWDGIKETLDDAMSFSCASACIPPCFVKQAKDYVGSALKICTVIGFPNGYSTENTKVSEAADAVRLGADEIDMVINICQVKDRQYDSILHEINAVKSACGDITLKVIIESCLLTDEEKIQMCHIISASNADYIKTSTGFAFGGATFDDIELFSKHISPRVKIKAAGGISSLEDAERFISLGADRLGTSRIVKIAKKSTAPSDY